VTPAGMAGWPALAAVLVAAASGGGAALVTIVKAPTSLVREPVPASAAAGSAALHPGLAVEKGVAAATVVTFASPESRLAELDREAIDGIARLAAKERYELLVWARAADASLVAEAQRRAAEVRTRAIAMGPLVESQIVTRITARPGAQGVDVVVSALRNGAPPPDASAAELATSPNARAAPALEAGEAGKRQVREAVHAARASIEACVAEVLERNHLARAEGVLRLGVSATGRVVRVTSDGDLAGTSVADCLGTAAATWTLPHAGSAYAADVPLTIIRGR
jgi:hypothetical protein